MLEIEVI